MTECSGKRVRIEYYDGNERFARYLPRTGRLRHGLNGSAGDSGWFLVDLDEPFECQVQLEGSSRTQRIEVSRFLLRSRWPDNEIGKEEPTSVSILLVDDARGLRLGAIDPRDYHDAAWGMCHTVEEGPAERRLARSPSHS